MASMFRVIGNASKFLSYSGLKKKSDFQKCIRICLSSYPPHQVVGLPSLSPTMETGSIAKWSMKEGDSFATGDIFCTVETDKATVDFEAQDDGVVAKILALAGTADLKVGEPIMVTIDNKDDLPLFADFKISVSDNTTLETQPSLQVQVPSSPLSSTEKISSNLDRLSSDRIIASPLAQKLAAERGYDLSKIRGTGPNGRIIAADVEEFVFDQSVEASIPASSIILSQKSEPSTAPVVSVLSSEPSPPSKSEGCVDYPIRFQVQDNASRLSQSKRNVPHYYLTVDISVDELLKLRSKLNEAITEDQALSVNDFILKAIGASMRSVPSVNGSWMENMVRVYESVDLNVVVGSGETLHSPVITDCAKKGLMQISRELNEAITSCENGEQLVNTLGTFTILNLGMYGVKSCAPIIREPQSCALAVGAMETRIVPNDDMESDVFYKECVMFTATLSCDHRVVDGAIGAQWLSAFKAHVENPSTLLL